MFSFETPFSPRMQKDEQTPGVNLFLRRTLSRLRMSFSEEKHPWFASVWVL
jgi:hypothetical protein